MEALVLVDCGPIGLNINHNIDKLHSYILGLMTYSHSEVSVSEIQKQTYLNKPNGIYVCMYLDWIQVEEL